MRNILLLFIFLSCTETKNDVHSFSYYKYYSGFDVVVVEEKAFFNQIETSYGDSLTFIFNDKFHFNDTISFTFGTSNSKYYSSVEERNAFLVLLTTKLYAINNKKHLVHKYALDAKSIDGCSLYFWDPQLGILLWKSDAWQGFRKLQNVGNMKKDKQVEELIDLIMQDVDFYHECSYR